MSVEVQSEGEVYSEISSLNLQEGNFCFIEFEDRFKLDPKFIDNFIGKQPKWGPLGYITYKRTYAREIPGNRTEEFWQTLQRNVEGEFSFLRQQIKSTGGYWDEEKGQELAQETYQRAWDFKFLPPGRGLWAMGSEYVYQNGSAALQNCCGITFRYISDNFAAPFVALFDYLMLGIGTGFDTRGAGTVVIQQPIYSDVPHVIPDTRLGWCALFERCLLAFVGKATLPTNIDSSLVRKEGTKISGFGGTASGPAPLLDLVSSTIVILTELIGKPITSTAIVDICNITGKCVVSGNVRRSSEIALGFEEDLEFLKLKDPEESKKIKKEMQLIAESHPEWMELEKDKKDYAFRQQGLSVIDERFINLQATIDMLSKFQQEILVSDSEWMKLNSKLWKLPLNNHRWSSNNSVFVNDFSNYEKLGLQTAANGEPGYVWLENMQKFGRLADDADWKDSLADVCNPCSEQVLHGSCEEQGIFKGGGPELCTLVETFPTKNEDLEDYLKTLKVAYLYGKVVTCIPTHNIETNKIMSKHRRIGLSMAGVADMYADNGPEYCINWWDVSFEYVKNLDIEYSKWMGIPESIKRCSIKPGGTVPLLPGVEGGMKLSSAPYYFRTIRVNATSPLIPKLVNSGYRVEDDLVSPRTKVVYFPVKSVSKKFSEDISIEEQMKLCVLLQKYWADNMVSCTITFKPEEADLIPSLLRKYKNDLKSISFLPLSNHGYAQAPYIPCSQQEYEISKSRLKDLDLSDVKMVHDIDEKFCEGVACTVIK